MQTKALNIHHKPTRKVGFVLKPHGFNGNLRIAIKDEDYEPAEFLLLEINDRFVPYPIENFNPQSGIIKLRFVNTLEQAEELLGLNILELGDEPLESDERFQIVGYHLIDSNTGQRYPITGIEVLPNNLLIEIRHGHKDALIPFHEDIVTAIDHENQTVTAAFPDGILDL